MKKIFIERILLSIVVFMCFTCCGTKVINGIEVSELLLIASKEQNIDYCKLLNEAFEGNDSSIRKLVLLKFYDGAGYDHGAVVVDLIELIGEDKFIYSLTTINDEQKKWIIGYIEVGLEYGNNLNLQPQTFKEAFPKVYDFLRDRRDR